MALQQTHLPPSHILLLACGTRLKVENGCFPLSWLFCTCPCSYCDKHLFYKYSASNLSLFFVSCFSAEDTVYFYRELLCYSLEKLEVSLITVSSFHNIIDEEEPHFDPKLFPIKTQPRCKKFKEKRVSIYHYYCCCLLAICTHYTPLCSIQLLLICEVWLSSCYCMWDTFSYLLSPSRASFLSTISKAEQVVCHHQVNMMKDV